MGQPLNTILMVGLISVPCDWDKEVRESEYTGREILSDKQYEWFRTRGLETLGRKYEDEGII